MSNRYSRIQRRLCYFLFAFLFVNQCTISPHNNSIPSFITIVSAAPLQNVLTMAEIATLRVREIKRQLALNYGYSNDELNKMIDKRELINALAFEEHKMHLDNQQIKKRRLWKQGIIVAIVSVVVVMFWPVLHQIWLTLCVNLEVYSDRKKYEISRCLRLRSKKGCFGMIVAIILDCIQLWLSVSVLLSWILPSRSKYSQYLFPTPNIPIRPAALLGTGSTNQNLTNMHQYGINVGPMLITWTLRYLNTKVEMWMGKVLLQAHQYQQKKQSKKSKKKEKMKKKKEKEVFMEETNNVTSMNHKTEDSNDVNGISAVNPKVDSPIPVPIADEYVSFNDLD